MEEVANRLGVSEKMANAGFDCPQEVLTRSAAELQKTLKLNESEIKEIMDAAASEAFPWLSRHKTADALVNEPAMITTGSKVVDNVLGGGIPLGSVTEIVGESSSGKSQLALQLCLTVQKPKRLGGLAAKAVYLHTEGRFPSLRLSQLTRVFCRRYWLSEGTVTQSILTMAMRNSTEQYRILSYQIPVLLSRNKGIRLIVIDSIGALYRGEQSTDRFEKITEVSQLGVTLKRIAAEYNVAIVAVNQVTDVLNPNPAANSSTPGQIAPELLESWMDFNLRDDELGMSHLHTFKHSLIKKPILGLTWSNAVTTRIRLARSPMIEGSPTRRVLFVEFSPYVARSGCEIVIGDGGVQGTHEPQDPHEPRESCESRHPSSSR